MSERHGHRVWRLHIDGQPRVVKWLEGAAARTEIGSISLLRRLGVPTVPVYASTQGAILMEDLDASPIWRLADESDIASADAGGAVADWYRALHAAGEALATGERPDFLRRHTDMLTADALAEAGRRLGLDQERAWRLAVEKADSLRACLDALSTTLNYADFHWTNLALTRAAPVRAVVFDYDQLGLGSRYSDYRNVLSVLSGSAADAFVERYGGHDEREEIVDRPLATMCALVLASRRRRFPEWARESRRRVVDGDLERDVERALGLPTSA